MTKGFIAGAFDIIHPGYISMFKEAAENCDYLIIGLDYDPSLERDNKLKPILTLEERMDILLSIRYIDEVYSYKFEKGLIELLKNINPDIRFLGEDYIGKKITGENLNIPIHYLSRNHGWSSTKFKNKIYNQIKQLIQNEKNDNISFL